LIDGQTPSRIAIDHVTDRILCKANILFKVTDSVGVYRSGVGWDVRVFIESGIIEIH